MSPLPSRQRLARASDSAGWTVRRVAWIAESHSLEQEARQYGNSDGERQHPEVRLDIERHSRSAVGHHGHERIGEPVSQRHSQRAAGRGQQHALRQQLAHDAQPAAANCETDRHLALARGGFGEQQVRDVRAGDQQHKGDHAHQDRERLREVLAQIGESIASGLDVDPLPEQLSSFVPLVARARRPRSRWRG